MSDFGRVRSIPTKESASRLALPNGTPQPHAASASAQKLDYTACHRLAEADNRPVQAHGHAAADDQATIDIFPREITSRHAKTCDGVTSEVVQVTRRELLEMHWRAPIHMVGFVE